MTEREETPEKNGVVFVLWDGKKIQLERRDTSDKLFFGFTIIPGGKIEKGETPDEAMFNEVMEEYGVAVLVYKPLCDFTDIENGGVLNKRRLYLVTKWSGVLSNPEESNGHIEATIQEAFTLCEHPLTKTFLGVAQKEISRLSA